MTPMTLTNAIAGMERELRFFPVENPVPRKLTSEQIRQFNEKGYLFPLDVFTPEDAGANRRYFDQLMSSARAAGHDSYSINGWHRYCRGIYELLHEPRILDYVADLIGPNIVSIMTHYFSKEPGDEQQVVWHQDASYWPLTPSKVVTVWLAIDDAEEANGAMQFVPGSHRHGQIPFEHSAAEEKNVLGQSVRDPEAFGGAPVSVCLKAGQISIHTDLLLHGSAPNRSSRRRCGLTLRYMPPEVRAQAKDHAFAFLCRGTDPDGYWQSWPLPSGEQIPEARSK
jgi:non-heme Fe2+,alpha-ketoglutarate-dependent halogenase